jgi:hypothetical protein
MFEALKRWWQRRQAEPASISKPEPLIDSPTAAEPANPVSLPSDPQVAGQTVDEANTRRSRKIYESNSAKQRAYRERLKASAAAGEPIAPKVAEPTTVSVQETTANPPGVADLTPIVAPETAPVIDVPLIVSRIPWRALDSLLRPGPRAMKPVEPVVKAAPVVAEPIPTTEPINWSEELRTDLPPRSPQHIARLLEFETPEQTRDRIQNDRARYANQLYSAGRSATNPQTAIVPADRVYSAKTTWVRR